MKFSQRHVVLMMILTFQGFTADFAQAKKKKHEEQKIEKVDRKEEKKLKKEKSAQKKSEKKASKALSKSIRDLAVPIGLSAAESQETRKRDKKAIQRSMQNLKKDEKSNLTQACLDSKQCLKAEAIRALVLSGNRSVVRTVAIQGCADSQLRTEMELTQEADGSKVRKTSKNRKAIALTSCVKKIDNLRSNKQWDEISAIALDAEGPLARAIRDAHAEAYRLVQVTPIESEPSNETSVVAVQQTTAPESLDVESVIEDEKMYVEEASTALGAY